jgi:peptidoglycan/xylan/chitin deacetylase (PgdA/CDA1 family)
VSEIAATHYTTLRPFREFFETGMPWLTYHKLGARPRGARIKGLYVRPALFERQLAELRAEGFHTPAFGQLPEKMNLAKTIALTFDDGFANAFENALRPLSQYGFHAIQFLVVNHIGQFNQWEVEQGEVRETLMDAARIKSWLAAGHEIGAHTLTHPFLTRLGLREAREEISAGKKKLEDWFGVPVRHFCYPYGDWNKSVRDVVQESGYATACTTDFGVNTARTPPFELKRIMARHRSVSLKAMKRLFR